MTRRADLKRNWPHHVVLTADKVRGLDNFTMMHDFANTLSVAPRTYWLRRDDADFVVFCFTKPEDAETFLQAFRWGAIVRNAAVVGAGIYANVA